MTKQCASCGGFCGNICQRENVTQPEQEPTPVLYVKDINGNFHPYKEKGHTENCAAFGDDCSENHLPTSRVGVGENDYTAQPAVTEQHKQEYQFGVYSAEDLDKAWKSGYDNCKAQSSWTLEDVKKAWKRGYARAKKEQRQNRVGIYTTPPQPKEPEQAPDASDVLREVTSLLEDAVNDHIEGGNEPSEWLDFSQAAIAKARIIQPQRKPMTDGSLINEGTKNIEQEPVAWCSQFEHSCVQPPRRKPLTDEQIKDCLDAADQMYCERDGDKEVFKARAIEAAHGIKGEA